MRAVEDHDAPGEEGAERRPSSRRADRDGRPSRRPPVARGSHQRRLAVASGGGHHGAQPCEEALGRLDPPEGQAHLLALDAVPDGEGHLDGQVARRPAAATSASPAAASLSRTASGIVTPGTSVVRGTRRCAPLERPDAREDRGSSATAAGRGSGRSASGSKTGCVIGVLGPGVDLPAEALELAGEVRRGGVEPDADHEAGRRGRSRCRRGRARG